MGFFKLAKNTTIIFVTSDGPSVCPYTSNSSISSERISVKFRIKENSSLVTIVQNSVLQVMRGNHG
jgi:hypothetical protein